jgi:hypothetical protein
MRDDFTALQPAFPLHDDFCLSIRARPLGRYIKPYSAVDKLIADDLKLRQLASLAQIAFFS